MKELSRKIQYSKVTVQTPSIIESFNRLHLAWFGYHWQQGGPDQTGSVRVLSVGHV